MKYVKFYENLYETGDIVADGEHLAEHNNSYEFSDYELNPWRSTLASRSTRTPRARRPDGGQR